MIKIDNEYDINLDGVTIFGSGTIILGKKSEIRYGTIIEMDNGILELGECAVIGYLSFLQISGEIYIGTGSLLGPHNSYISSTHVINNGNSVGLGPSLERGIIKIGHDVWIGANCTINYNVNIGDHSIIGANSFVNKDVKNKTIVAGSPIRYIRSI